MAEYEVIALAIVRREDEVLLGLKDPTKIHSLQGKWFFPGGRVNYKESLEQAAIRETKEETGVDIKVVRLLDTRTKKDIWPDGRIHHACLVYFECATIGNSNNIKAHDDIVEVKWVKTKDLGKFITTDVSPKVREYLRELGWK